MSSSLFKRKMRYIASSYIDFILYMTSFMFCFAAIYKLTMQLEKYLGSRFPYNLLPYAAFAFLLLLFFYVYFVLLFKALKGTPGMRLMGVKIDNYQWFESLLAFMITNAAFTIIAPVILYFPFSKDEVIFDQISDSLQNETDKSI